MDALRVFPGSKVRRAGMPVRRAGMPVRRAGMPVRRADMPISREDPRYHTQVRGFNLRWVGNPRFVQVVGDAEQVRETVQRAVFDHMRITIRSGGHCYEDFVCANDDGVIIDLSGLNGIYEENGMIVVESGCTLWDVYFQMYKKWGVTIPGGSCFTVAVGGHVCGGGYWTFDTEESYHLKWIRGFYNQMYGEDGPLRDEHVGGYAPRSSVGTKAMADPVLRLELPTARLRAAIAADQTGVGPA